MGGRRRVHIGAEVDSEQWEQFREQAFAGNLTTGQLLDKLIAAYLEMMKKNPQQSTTFILVRPTEDIVLEQEQQQDSLVEEGQEQDLYEETVQEPDETLKLRNKEPLLG